MHLFQHLRGQIVQHTLKSESKSKLKNDESDTLTVLRFDAVRFLFEIYADSITDRVRMFEKLQMLCDLLYNKHDFSEYVDTRKQSRREANQTFAALMGRGKS